MSDKIKIPRNSRWTTILYPESAPSNFLDLLKDFHIPFLLSPLHDKDVDANGVVKKSHYHLVLYFDSLKSASQAQVVFDAIGGVGCQSVQSPVSYARYLIHADDSDKYQYSAEDVVAYGLDYMQCSLNEKSQKYLGISDVISYVIENNIQSFSRLLIVSSQLNRHIFETVCDNAYLVKAFITSIKNDKIECSKQEYLESTGGEYKSAAE
ncbi:replication protein [Glycocaulis alkaliphilus]|uniref:replication protein n=1 Tax=Glycocaulis alkaliphilus TaxID=1434191 RepID=UPI00166DF9A4|nr:replication protein [Glycocaulis alkaliphilus]GGB87226.1 plasmid replication protein [Glycocaulis alkaliphilus]